MICSSASWRSEQRAQLLRDDCRAIAAPEWPVGAVADRASAARRVVQAGAHGDGRERITVADSAHGASNPRRDSVLRPNLQKFFLPGSSPRKSSGELVLARERALHACEDGAEKLDNDVEKPLCQAAFLHSTSCNALARSWTRWLFDASRRAWSEAPEALGDASRLSTIR
jgi:hypothetical protein